MLFKVELPLSDATKFKTITVMEAINTFIKKGKRKTKLIS